MTFFQRTMSAERRMWRERRFRVRFQDRGTVDSAQAILWPAAARAAVSSIEAPKLAFNASAWRTVAVSRYQPGDFDRWGLMQGVMWPTNRLDRRDGMDLEENSGRFELSEFQAHDKLDEEFLAKS